jgi:hypothetical protein
MPKLDLLRTLIERVPDRAKALPPQAAVKPSPDAWSGKEEFGHLLDSAANNHQRIVRGQLEDRPAMPGYDGDRWVALHRYQERSWPELADSWAALNRQLLAAAEAAPDSAWTRTCTVGGSEPLTLEFIFDDYLDHMIGHLKHIGIEVSDLR